MAEKEKRIIPSPDPAPPEAALLAALARDLPDVEIRQIRSMSCGEFRDLATRGTFSLTV